MWVEDLSLELHARGVPARERARIVAELTDHIACEPGCQERLGDPAALARTFADELASARTRRSALHAFAALAVAGIVLAGSLLALTRAHPGYDSGISLALFFPALLGMFIAPQVAMVSGTLAALRAVRRRRARALPAAEVRLIARRARVALVAGLAAMAGIELYVIDFAHRLPAGRLAGVGGLAAVAAGGLLAAWRSLSRAAAVTVAGPGEPGDVYDDLPIPARAWLRRRPWALGLIGSVAVAVAMAAFEAHAEHSLAEGIQRGAVEGLAAAVGFACLGRAVGLVSPRPRRTPHPAARLDRRG